MIGRPSTERPSRRVSMNCSSTTVGGVVVSGEPVVGEVVPVSPVEPAGSVSDGSSTDEPAVVADGALEAALG
jgi:hypothetical protein